MANNKPVLISGIKPSGRLHIGNYLGALKNFVNLQNAEDYQCLFFVADLHSLTVDYDSKAKRGEVLDVIKKYLAAGIDPKKSSIFVQSSIPTHSELTWLLSTVTPLGDLKRMTQFKDKSRENPENINAGLLFYPVLMASDVLLYDAKFVPVGDDQLQHLEITRKIARRFNAKFGETFKEPEPLLTTSPRLMSLNDPDKKMSKSLPNGCLFLDDSPEEIKYKIKSAVTDSGSKVRFDSQNKKAISNLMVIYSSFGGKSIKEVEEEFKGSNYRTFKERLTDLLINKLKPLRESNISDRQAEKMVEKGNKRAGKMARKKIEEVKKAMGLL